LVAFFQANDREADVGLRGRLCEIPLKTGENPFQQPKSAFMALENPFRINGLNAISAGSDSS
jgi:hypothetical protein